MEMILLLGHKPIAAGKQISENLPVQQSLPSSLIWYVSKMIEHIEIERPDTTESYRNDITHYPVPYKLIFQNTCKVQPASSLL